MSDTKKRPVSKSRTPAKPPAPPTQKATPPPRAATRAKPRAAARPTRPAAAAPQVAAASTDADGSALSIFMIASEAHPYAKTGGLAEVVAALPDALGRLGHRVTLVIPRYHGIDVSGARTQVASLHIGSTIQPVTFRTAEPRGGVTVVFVDIPDLFDRAGGLYTVNGVDYPDNGWRFAVFCRAALDYARLEGKRPSIIHAHDWQTGLVPVYQKMLFSPDPIVGGVPAVFTIHNLAFQGVFPASTIPTIGLGWEVLDIQALEFWSQISYMKGGINFSERLTTVSPTYAREILTPEFGFGLDGALRRRADALSGILNGIDTGRWSPESDPFSGAPYTAADLSGKTRAKAALLRGAGLPEGTDALRKPIIGVLSRLTDQKGFDLVAASADRLMSLDATWVMLGSGDARYEDLWRSLAARYPGRVSATIGFDETLAHRIEAGSDLFLMPSRFEPCGLNQMYSLRYGTVPIVRATGGLADTVTDISQPDGTGVVFSEYSASALVAAIQRALDAFARPAEWQAIQRRGMKMDFSWDASAREYVKVYEGAVAAARQKP